MNSIIVRDIIKDLLISTSIGITAAAASMPLLLRRRTTQRGYTPPPRRASGAVLGDLEGRPEARDSADQILRPRFLKGVYVLAGFTLGLLVILTIIVYWGSILTNIGDIFFGIWLFVTMLIGMLIQVIVTHLQSGKPLNSISSAELLRPMCFSVIVFYSIWCVAASAPRGAFSFYAAFLNGYCWRNFASSIKPVNARAMSQK